MTASGAKLTESGFDVPGVLMTVLLMTYPPNASCQAGGDVTTRRQVRAATGWKFRPRADSSALMITRGMYTPREPAAGGDNSTPAPIQDYVLSSTPISSTAANAEDLAIFDFVATRIRPVEARCQGHCRKTPMIHRCDTAGVHVRTPRVTLQHGRCTRAHTSCDVATRPVYTCAHPV